MLALEVVRLPVTDIDRALAFYTEQAGRDYASFADFADPDGSTWTLQERGHRVT